MPRLKEVQAVLSGSRSKELAKIIYEFFPHPLDVHAERLINYLNSLDSLERELFLEKLNTLMKKIPAGDQPTALGKLSSYLKLVDFLEQIIGLVRQSTLLNLFQCLAPLSRFIPQLEAFLSDMFQEDVEVSIFSRGTQKIDTEKLIKSFCGLLCWIDREKGAGFFVSSTGEAIAVLNPSQLERLQQKEKNQPDSMAFFIRLTHFLSEEFGGEDLFSYCSLTNAKVVLHLVEAFPSYSQELSDKLCAIRAYNVCHNDALFVPNKLNFLALWLIHLHLDWTERLQLLRSFFPRGVADEDIKALADAVLLFDHASPIALIAAQYKILSQMASYLERTECALVVRSTADLQCAMLRALLSRFSVEQYRPLLEPLFQAHMMRKSLSPKGRVSSFLPQLFFKQCPSQQPDKYALVPYTGSHSPALTSAV